jgi:phage terminase small subunit
MKAGRKPKPTVLHRLHHTYRPVRHDDRLEPIAPGELTDPPAHLTGPQKTRWRQVLKDAPKSVLRKVDSEALTAFVIAADLVEQANIAQQALDNGKTLPFLAKSDKKLPTLSPYVKLLLRALPMLVRTASELGFTPAGRVNVRVDQSTSTSASKRWLEFDELKRQAENETLLAAKPASPQPQ